MRNYSTIIQAITTEKSSTEQCRGKYTFLVTKDASKIDIKNAIKALFNADVATVRTMLVPKKTRMLKGRYEWTKRPVFKKAIITLKGKKTIDPNKIGEAKSGKKSK